MSFHLLITAGEHDFEREEDVAEWVYPTRKLMEVGARVVVIENGTNKFVFDSNNGMPLPNTALN